MLCLGAQLCPTLCNPMACSLSDPSVHGDSPGKNTEVGCHSLPQGIFPTQGLNPGLPHYRWILYHLSQQGSPRILKWVAYPFARGSSWPRNWSRVSCIAGRFFTSGTTREAPGGGVRWGKDLENIAKEPESLALAGKFFAAEPPGEARSDFYLQVIQQPPSHPQSLFPLKTTWYVCLFFPTPFHILGVRATYTFVVMRNWQFRNWRQTKGLRVPCGGPPRLPEKTIIFEVQINSE